MKITDRIHEISTDIAELRGQFTMFVEHAATKADIAELKTLLQDRPLPMLTTKQKSVLITSITTAIAAAGSAIYALISK